MKITFLGQAGLYFENKNIKILIDPYLSNSVQSINPKNYRRQPIDESFFNIKPDVIVITHNHLDHFDTQTLKHFINIDTNTTILSPFSVYNEIRKIGGQNNYVLFNAHTEVTLSNVIFSAVKAEHSDPSAIGFVIDDGKNKYYITGDTLYNRNIFTDIPNNIHAVFLPINGVGNNMNAMDAKRFCEKIKPKFAIPIHFGMFDQLTGEEFEYDNRVVPKIYKEIILK